MAVTFDSSYPELLVELVFPAPIGTVDVTNYWLEGSTFIGRQRETDTYDGACTIKLDNWDGRFTPGQTAGTYSSGGVSFVRPRVGVRIRATWSATSYPVWRGYVTNWQDDWALAGQDTTVTIACAGPQSILAAWTGRALDPLVGDSELAGARVSRILAAAAAAPFGSSVAVGNVRFNDTDLAGNGATLIADVCDAEGGAFWYDAGGVATFEDRTSLVVNTRSNTSQATFSDASILFRDPVPVSGDDLIYNDVTFQREGGQPQNRQDASSIGVYGTRSLTRTGFGAQLDVDMDAVAQYNLARFKDAQNRIGELTIDPVMSAAAYWPHALGRKIRDKVTVSGTVARPGLTVAGDAFVEGITHTIAQHSWQTTFAFSSAAPWAGFAVPTWDSGVWDTSEWFY